MKQLKTRTIDLNHGKTVIVFAKHHQHLEDEAFADQACLQLAFYLARWGMLRGSSFLLFKDYKVHQYFIGDVVRNPVYKEHFQMDQGELLDVAI